MAKRAKESEDSPGLRLFVIASVAAGGVYLLYQAARKTKSEAQKLGEALGKTLAKELQPAIGDFDPLYPLGSMAGDKVIRAHLKEAGEAAGQAGAQYMALFAVSGSTGAAIFGKMKGLSVPDPQRPKFRSPNEWFVDPHTEYGPQKGKLWIQIFLGNSYGILGSTDAAYDFLEELSAIYPLHESHPSEDVLATLDGGRIVLFRPADPPDIEPPPETPTDPNLPSV